MPFVASSSCPTIHSTPFPDLAIDHLVFNRVNNSERAGVRVGESVDRCSRGRVRRRVDVGGGLTARWSDQSLGVVHALESDATCATLIPTPLQYLIKSTVYKIATSSVCVEDASSAIDDPEKQRTLV
jgi:hypothetical protein